MQTRQRAMDEGFSLLECLIAVVLFAIVAAITVPMSLRVIGWQRLNETTALLTERLRLTQAMSQVDGQASLISLDMYQPDYWMRTGMNINGYYGFSPGVNYHDGYLQLNTGRIAYDMYGNSEVSGYIRLTFGANEQDIKLYMGGLQERVGVLP